MIIRLIGLAGAGKDTLAQMLLDAGVPAVIDRHAAPLKTAARKVFGLRFDDRDVKEVAVTVSYAAAYDAACAAVQDLTGYRLFDYIFRHVFADRLTRDGRGLVVSPREYQQLLGTEIVRAIEPDAFVARLERDAEARYLAHGLETIVPDCRFPNEVGRLTVLIVPHPSQIPATRPEHVSEHMAYDATVDAMRGGKPFTHTVFNDSTLAALRLEAGYIARRIHP